MSSLKPVGLNTVFTTSTGSSASIPISQLSDSIRVLPEGAGVHVAIGTNPTATNQNFYVGVGEPEEISIGPVGSHLVTGITTGSTTTIDFPEGTSSPFGVGDAVTLTAPDQSTFNFTHKIVSSVNTTSGVDGFFGSRIVIDHDSSSGNPAALTSNNAQLRRSIKVAVKTNSGTGKVFIQQVQVS